MKTLSSGVAIAEVFAAAGREVHLATQDFIVGNELARAGDLAPANARLAQAGVVMHRRSILRSVAPSHVVIEDRFTGTRSSLDVAVVVDLHKLDPVGRRTTGGRDGRRLERFAEVCHYLPDRPRIGDERDESDVAATPPTPRALPRRVNHRGPDCLWGGGPGHISNVGIASGRDARGGHRPSLMGFDGMGGGKGSGRRGSRWLMWI